MERLALKELEIWHQKKDRMPLILRGARQVGKSTLVKLFAEKHGLDLIVINFEKTKLGSAHASPFTMRDLLLDVQAISQKRITPRTLIFFDEIQEQPEMIGRLRYFYEEEPRLAVIAAGSLLEIRLKQDQISFPVGRVEFLHLGPMSFFEFLKAQQKDLLLEALSAGRLTDTVHALALQELKKYYFVGGMPKAVLSFIETGSLQEVRETQDQILQTFQADFPKYNSRIDVSRMSRIFGQSALQVGRKLIYQHLDEHSTSRDIKRVVELLIDALVVTPCYHSDATMPPLAASVDERILRLFFLDIGLLNCLHQLSYVSIEKEFQSTFATKGQLAEQFVAQHLQFFRGYKSRPHLFYWLRDKGPQKGEIDFLVQKEDQIFPIEVKAEKGGRLKSLFYFALEKSWGKAIKFSTDPFEKGMIQHRIGTNVVKVELTQLPLYLVEVLDRYL